MITCNITNEYYIGVTVMKSRGGKTQTLRQRWVSHLYKAFVLEEEWGLPAAIRKYGKDSFHMLLLDVVRGKKSAFAMEAELINTMGAKLNTRARKLSIS
jgi:hypothetical protein